MTIIEIADSLIGKECLDILAGDEVELGHIFIVVKRSPNGTRVWDTRGKKHVTANVRLVTSKDIALGIAKRLRGEDES